MDGLIEGRIVHFVMPSGEHRPAIVVKVWRYPDSSGPEPILKAPENGCCNLQVFTDGSNDGVDEVRHGHLWFTSCIYSENPEPGTWHWIERA
jgi:hypothetical protein